MDDSSSQDPAELAAHYGEHGPVVAAQSWLDAVVIAGDYASAWSLMTENLRLVRAQAWLWNNRELFEVASESLDEQAAMLAADPSIHPYWDEFAEIEIATMREAWPPEDYEEVGIASKPRPLAPNVELVLFIKMSEAAAADGATPVLGGGVVIAGEGDEGVPVHAFAQIVVEYVSDGWLIAGHNGEVLPIAGWPPMLA